MISIYDMFNIKTRILIGGTGSFGRAVMRRCLDTGIRAIRFFSRDQKKQAELADS